MTTRSYLPPLLAGTLLSILFTAGCAPQTLCDCAWAGTITTWLDANGNGARDQTDPALAGVTIRSNYGSDITNPSGEASFELWMPGCPCGQGAGLYFEAEPPMGYELITPNRVDPGQADHVDFGFAYDPAAATRTPNPIPLTCTTYYGQQFLGDNYVTDVGIDLAQHVWVTTLGGGVSEYDPREDIWRRHAQVMYANTVAVDNDGSVWVGGFHGVYVASMSWQPLHASCPADVGSVSDIPVSDIAFDLQGNAWIGTPYGALVVNPQTGECDHITCQGWANGPSSEGVGPNDVERIAVAGDGSVWLLTFWNLLSGINQRALEVEPTTCQTFSPYTDQSDKHRLPFEPVALTSTAGLDLWLAGIGAIARLETDSGSVQSFDLSQPSTRSYYNDILAYPDGSLLIGTSSLGLLRFRPREAGGRPLVYDATYGLAHNDVTSLAVANDNSIWLGTTYGVSHCSFLSP